mmetsp:Transcript_21721/g.54703  ORF Transcript_21721/g.54703 Transcript_21721/m.54703 type:complete len:229 (+) Transcript_21721:449-1135(+)
MAASASESSPPAARLVLYHVMRPSGMTGVYHAVMMPTLLAARTSLSKQSPTCSHASAAEPRASGCGPLASIAAARSIATSNGRGEGLGSATSASSADTTKSKSGANASIWQAGAGQERGWVGRSQQNCGGSSRRGGVHGRHPLGLCCGSHRVHSTAHPSSSPSPYVDGSVGYQLRVCIAALSFPCPIHAGHGTSHTQGHLQMPHLYKEVVQGAAGLLHSKTTARLARM